MKNVGIFCGGYSPEFEISMLSAQTILDNLDRSKYNPFLVQVKREGWFAQYKEEICEVSPIDFTFQTKSGVKIHIDIAHVYIHGDPDENGKLQAYFEIKGLPYINSNSLSSQLSFDKWFCNQFLKNFDIKVANSHLIKKHKSYSIEKIGKDLGFPLFVKPADSGSSYGISKVYQLTDLQSAIDNAFKEGQTVLCESFLKGTEVTCGIYQDSEGIHALPCIEIVPESDFFDYEAKYLGKSQEIVPARISDELTKKIQDLSVEIYELLQLRSIARIDFMAVENEPYVIEVNTTPGFSGESLVPKMLKYAEISIQDFWSQIYDYELSR